MENIIEAINKLFEEKQNPVIAIDGPCASGKSTLTALLSEKFGFQIIHTDDFFLPSEMRTVQRLSEAGGNIHYERFNAEVANMLKSSSDFIYGVYSCRNGTFAPSEPVIIQKPVAIEGSYALHPAIDIEYDLKIFVEADLETRLERILRRNGADALEIFKSKWIPLEDRYFREFDIKNRCEIIIKTDR